MLEKKLQYQKELTDCLDEASRLYYNNQSSSLSDTEFDIKFKELQSLEKETGTIYPNSPTQRVGSDVQSEFKKLEHPEPMLTIENTYNGEELQKWLSDNPSALYEISTKFDGVSLELHYQNGVLVSAATRGDKNVGDDVTANARTIKSIPLSIGGCDGLDVYVRGEVLMLRSVFDVINEELESLGKEPMKNCRNAASGSIKQLDSRITATRQLSFRPWDILVFKDNQFIETFSGYTELAKTFEKLGFYLEDFAKPVYVTGDKLIETVDNYKKTLDESHPDFDYDGVVVKIASVFERRNIGTKDHRAIQWGIARKWNEERAGLTVIENVTWQVGRTGTVTPVANFRPFPLDGVTVTNATLHNLDFIEKNNLAIGQYVKVIRSGGVIPDVAGNATAEEMKAAGASYGPDAKAMSIKYPSICPVCGTELVREGDFLKCTNEKCKGRLLESIEYWCSKKVMNIDGIGPEFIRDLIDKQLVTCPIDLYLLERNYTVKELLRILGSGYGQTSIKKKLKAIKDSLKQPAYRVLAGTGIAGIGPRMAKILLSEFGSISGIFAKSEEELRGVAGIGEVLAKNIASYALNTGWSFLTDCHELGLNTVAENENSNSSGSEKKEQVLYGLKVVFSGSSKYFLGDTVEEFLESYGAKCGHSISSKTNYLVTGDKPGPKKVQSCKDMNIPILEEDKFYEKFGLNVQAEL